MQLKYITLSGGVSRIRLNITLIVLFRFSLFTSCLVEHFTRYNPKIVKLGQFKETISCRHNFSTKNRKINFNPDEVCMITSYNWEFHAQFV